VGVGKKMQARWRILTPSAGSPARNCSRKNYRAGRPVPKKALLTGKSAWCQPPLIEGKTARIPRPTRAARARGSQALTSRKKEGEK